MPQRGWITKRGLSPLEEVEKKFALKLLGSSYHHALVCVTCKILQSIGTLKSHWRHHHSKSQKFTEGYIGVLREAGACNQEIPVPDKKVPSVSSLADPENGYWCSTCFKAAPSKETFHLSVELPGHRCRISIQDPITRLYFDIIKGMEVWTVEWRSRSRKRPSTGTNLLMMHQIWTRFTLSTIKTSTNMLKGWSDWILLETITSSPYGIMDSWWTLTLPQSTIQHLINFQKILWTS